MMKFRYCYIPLFVIWMLSLLVQAQDESDFPTAAHAILDDEGQIIMLVNFNTDLGDGWEHTFDRIYPTRYSNETYKLGINTVIYALSH